MKKIIFGILSVLFISPVFAQSDPSWTVNTAISFESTKYNQNVTYLIYGNPRNSSKGLNTNLLYVNENGYTDFVPSIKQSLNQIDSGVSVYDWSSAFSFGSDYISSIGGLNQLSLFGFNLSGGLPETSSVLYYTQGVNSARNGLIKWGNGTDYSTFGSLTNSYVRLFYSDTLGFSSINPSGNQSSNAGFFEIFSQNSLYTLTSKGRVYDYAGQNSIGKSFVLSSLMDGYSYIIKSGDRNVFHSVLPGFSTFINGSNYVVPDWLDVEGYLFIKTDGDKENGNKDGLLVLREVNDSIFYSNYICGNIGYTEYGDGKYQINLKSSCQFLGGGTITGGTIFGRSDYITGLNSVFSKVNSSNTRCGFYSFYGNYLSLFVDNTGSNSFLSVKSFIDNSCPSNLFYTGTLLHLGFRMIPNNGINLLRNFDNTSNSSTSIQEDYFNIYCSSDIFGTNPYCNGNYTGDFICFPDNSGNVVCAFTNSPNITSEAECLTISSGGYHQYWDYTGNQCVSYTIYPEVSSSPYFDYSEYFSGSELTGLQFTIGNAFSDIVGPNFKFYSCPFRSPLKAFNLSSIGGLSEFLLDKFFDINITGPFNCLLGGILYSETDSQSLGSQLLSGSYNGEKYLNNFPDNVKSTINWLLFAGMILFFWAFRPKEH